MTDPIQKAIDVLDDVSRDYDSNGFGGCIDEALSALRGMKAVDVGELKKDFELCINCCSYIHPSSHAQVIRFFSTYFNHLTASGYVIMKAGE